MLTDEPRDKVADIARLVGSEDERRAYLVMLAHDLVANCPTANNVAWRSKHGGGFCNMAGQWAAVEMRPNWNPNINWPLIAN